jgi:polysaccharide export outer membrane protein
VNVPEKPTSMERGHDQANSEHALAEIDLKRAQDRVDWATKMKQKGYLSEAQLLADKLNLDRAQVAHQQAQAKNLAFRKALENPIVTKRPKPAPAVDQLRVRAFSNGILDIQEQITKSEKKLKSQSDLLKELQDQVLTLKLMVGFENENRESLLAQEQQLRSEMVKLSLDTAGPGDIEKLEPKKLLKTNPDRVDREADVRVLQNPNSHSPTSEKSEKAAPSAPQTLTTNNLEHNVKAPSLTVPGLAEATKSQNSGQSTKDIAVQSKVDAPKAFDPANLPREGSMKIMPDYVVDPPDLLLVEVLEALPGRPITGEHLVRPDGKISLGFYGEVYVAGLTLEQVKEKVVLHLRKYLADEALGLVAAADDTGKKLVAVAPRDSNRVFVDVTGYNSKRYYVMGQVAHPGTIPVTGRETILDALNYAGGVIGDPKDSEVFLIRPAKNANGKELRLPVDVNAIIQEGDVKTNYQLMPDDRVIVKKKNGATVKVEPSSTKPEPKDVESKVDALAKELADLKQQLLMDKQKAGLEKMLSR